MIEVAAAELNGRLIVDIDHISVRPPGAELTFWADCAAYADGIRDALPRIEPELSGEANPKPDF